MLTVLTVCKLRTVQLKWMELNDTITYLWIVNCEFKWCYMCCVWLFIHRIYTYIEYILILMEIFWTASKHLWSLDSPTVPLSVLSSSSLALIMIKIVCWYLVASLCKCRMKKCYTCEQENTSTWTHSKCSFLFAETLHTNRAIRLKTWATNKSNPTNRMHR